MTGRAPDGGPAGGSPRGARHRIPLRTQLVAAVLVLVAVTIVVIGTAGTVKLRSNLIARVDGQLVSAAARMADPAASALRNGGPAGPGDEHGQPRPAGVYFAEACELDGPCYPIFAGSTGVLQGTAAPSLPTPGDAGAAGLPRGPLTVDADSGGGSWRVLAAPLVDSATNAAVGTVVVAQPLDDVRTTVRQLVQIDVVVGVGALAVLGLLAWLAVVASLRPLAEVEHTAQAIAGGDLTRRVPASDPRTEVGRLAQSLNAMLGQIETAFRAQQRSEGAARASEDRMRRFVGDAGHELRTPLTSIRGFAELYRQGAVPDRADLDRVMRRIEGEAARMGLLVEDLLLLARLDQQRPLEHRPVDLLALATDTVHDARAVGRDHRVSLHVLTDGPAPVVLGDESRLRQVFANLVGNALAHTPAGTAVDVSVGAEGHEATVEVRDDGAGMTPEDAARVFERFYRVDSSRSRQPDQAGGGSGLGLSIVAALVSAHRGRVDVRTEPGGGATFTVRLPLATASAAVGEAPERPELGETPAPEAQPAPSAG